MPDFKEEIRKRLAGLSLSPTREAEIVEELSQHLEDQYEQALSAARPKRRPGRRCCTELNENDLLASGTEARRAPRPPKPGGRWEQKGRQI